jgi:hypothetical protein
MSVQPQPWPEPAPEIVAAGQAMYWGKRERPLPVMVRDQLGEWLSDEAVRGCLPGNGVKEQPGIAPDRGVTLNRYKISDFLFRGLDISAPIGNQIPQPPLSVPGDDLARGGIAHWTVASRGRPGGAGGRHAAV